MSEKIIRGTTPSYILDFSYIDDFGVEDLMSISMILMQRGIGIKKDLSEGCIVDVANNCICYHFSEEDTFSLVSGFSAIIETTVVVSGEVMRVGLSCYKVEKTLRNATMLGGR